QSGHVTSTAQCTARKISKPVTPGSIQRRSFMTSCRLGALNKAVLAKSTAMKQLSIIPIRNRSSSPPMCKARLSEANSQQFRGVLPRAFSPPFMKVDLPDLYNAATTFIDENIAQGRGDKIAIYYEDQKVTYQEVFEKVNRTGNALRDLGIEIENRVLLILPDSPAFAYSFFGAIKIGAVAVPTNPGMFATDYEYLINDSRARAIIVHESVLPEIEKIWNKTPFLKRVIVVGAAHGKALPYEEVIARASDKLDAEKTTKDDVCFWGYTSGSTGSPKGAVHLQHDMITITDLFVKPVLKMSSDDLCFSASKMFFSYGLGNSLYFPFRFGASTVLWPEKPDPEKILQVIERYRPTFFFSVPTLYARFLRVQKKYDLSSLRICLSSGEPLPPALFHQWKNSTGLELLDVVGSTEAAHDFLANRPGRAQAGSSGEVTPAFEAKIVDDDGREL